MPTLFLSYRRSDSPQACRVYEWLVRRFGEHAVFMDVSGIPLAVDFPDHIRQTIARSHVLIALIGAGWSERVAEADDPVRMEIETAIAHGVPVWPVLIGNTAMPDADELPASIADIAAQNAVTAGVSLDFDTHMRTLLPRLESLLEARAAERTPAFDATAIERVCEGIMRFLHDRSGQPDALALDAPLSWWVAGATRFQRIPENCVTLYLHRVTGLAEVLELHFLLSFWIDEPGAEHLAAGWVMRELERTPLLPGAYLATDAAARWQVKIRRGDEDPRQVWKMITDAPLRLSLTYVAGVAPAET